MTQTQPTPFALDWDRQVSIRLLVESAPLAVAIVNRAGQLVYVNAKLEKLFGYESSELLGQPVEVLIPHRFHAAHVQHRQGYVGQPHERAMGSGMDLAGRRKDGSEFPLEAGLSHLDTGGETVIIATITDISKRKQIAELLEQRVEERTHELERRQRVAEGLGQIVAMLNSNLDLERILNHIVVQAMELLGAQAGTLDHWPTADHRSVIQVRQGLLANVFTEPNVRLPYLNPAGVALSPGSHRVIEDLAGAGAGENADQNVRSAWLHACGCRALLASPLTVQGVVNGSLILYYGQPRHFVAEDLELAQTLSDQAALAIDSARLRAEIERSAVTAERNRLARDLHDAVTQTLFSASMIAEVLPRIWRRNPGEGERRLAELHELTRGALAEMRTLLLELRPTKLVEVPIEELLRQLAEGIAGRARVAVAVQIEGEADLPVDAKVAFYRIAQEALNNVAKHAQAHQATVSLRCQPDSVELLVRDDGRGFIFDRIRPDHLGLGIMRERADGIGATLHVISQPGQGATIRALWKTNAREPLGSGDRR